MKKIVFGTQRVNNNVLFTFPLNPAGTCMCAQVSSEGVSPAAGIVTDGAFEGLLSGVQFDVSQQVALLGEGGSTLAALEGPLACQRSFRHKYQSMVVIG